MSTGFTPSALSLHPSPFGSKQPTVPVAKSVTIARVTAPISVDRTYQSAFLGSLKAYFSNTKRLVKQGDLIGVGLNSDVNNLPLDEAEQQEVQEADQK